MIDITILGTAALLPLPERALTSVLLSVGGRSVLFDCGEGTQTAARRHGVSLMKTDFIVLTHFHGDHVFGLPGLLQTMSVMGRTEKLNIIAPPGLNRELAPLLTLAGALNFPVALTEAGDSPIRLCELADGFPAEAVLTPVVTEHRVVSRGYVFTLSRSGKFLPGNALALGIPVRYWSVLQNGGTAEYGGRTFVMSDVCTAERKGIKILITGDTSYCRALADAGKGADLIVSEATYGDGADEELALARGHMTFAHAARLAKEAGAERLVLTHFSQKMKDPADFLPNAEEIFPGAAAAADGMKLTLNFDE